MQGQIIKGKATLLRSFLLSMVGIAGLFSVLAIGIWIYTTEVIKREKQLISELLPELDAAHQLTAVTARLQSQGLLLSSSRDARTLSKRSSALEATILQSRQTLSTFTTIELAERTELERAVDDIAQVATGLADMKRQQLLFQRNIKAKQQLMLDVLSELEKSIQQRVFRLTEHLQDFNELNVSEDAAERASSVDDPLFIAQVDQYDSINLAIQDYLLFVQDVVSLSAIVERLPLLTTAESIDDAVQRRDLLISALVSRSIYIRDGFSATELLPAVRALRSRMRDEDSLFTLQRVVVTQVSDQGALDSLLREHTSRILVLADDLRNDSRDTVNMLAARTLSGLDEYRGFLLLISALTLLVLVGISYWLLYRKTVVPLVAITRQLDAVGTSQFPTAPQSYFLHELSTLSSAMVQLDAAQKSMNAKDVELKGINEDLQRANQELEQFAHIASHDLQEPLRKLQQFSDLLEEDYESVLDDDGRFFLHTIRNAAQRMSALIKETLAYSRAGSSNQKIECVDLGVLLTQLLDEMDLAVIDAEAEFDVSDLPVVHANSVGMAQLFRNLMINALKYKKPDTPARVKISMPDSTENAFQPVVIRIEDNGIGIDNQYLDRIFQPFERLQSGDVRGTGLGLAICKKVCDSHGWKLQVSSEPGTGTTFEIHMSVASLAN